MGRDVAHVWCYLCKKYTHIEFNQIYGDTRKNTTNFKGNDCRCL